MSKNIDDAFHRIRTRAQRDAPIGGYHIEQAKQAILTDLMSEVASIEPKLGEIDITPESYDDVVKVIRWYKDKLPAAIKNYIKGE